MIKLPIIIGIDHDLGITVFSRAYLRILSKFGISIFEKLAVCKPMGL